MSKLSAEKGEGKALLASLKNVKVGDHTTLGPLLKNILASEVVLYCHETLGEGAWVLDVRSFGIRVAGLKVTTVGNDVNVEVTK